MNSENPYAPPATQVVVTEPETATPPAAAEPIGGWLIVVAIGIVFSPVRIVSQLFPVYSDLLSSGSWAALTTPGAAAYHPLWMPILVLELVMNTGLFCAWIYIAVLFFKKRKNLPKLYISLLSFTVAFQIGDAWALSLVMPNTPIFDPETTREVARSLGAACIWIPYMLLSKRVKATFVR